MMKRETTKLINTKYLQNITSLLIHGRDIIGTLIFNLKKSHIYVSETNNVLELDPLLKG